MGNHSADDKNIQNSTEADAVETEEETRVDTENSSAEAESDACDSCEESKHSDTDGMTSKGTHFAPRSKKWLVIMIAFVAVFAVSLTAVLWIFLDKEDVSEYKNPSSSTISFASSDRIQSPVDFYSLQTKNPDVCAWLKVPNTNIDYPILQSSKDEKEDYYINHTIDKKYKFAGSLYIQKYNTNDFTDPNTVIYGHNMKNGTMFRDLHKFRKEDFFNENSTFYIYTPGHVLTYKIFSAYKYDDRNIMTSFDFNDTNVFAQYIESAKNPTSMIKNTRDVPITINDKIVTLSTCISEENYRYLVQGVLINDELTY